MNIIRKKTFEDLVYWNMGSNRLGQPKIFVNCFLIDGLLIDTGHPLIAKDFLKVIDNQRIDQVVVTHHHEDHSGNVNGVKNLKKIPVMASPRCCDIMKSPPRVSPVQMLSWGQNQAALLRPLDLTQQIETNNISLQIIETPGHAEDHISLYEANRGWLFSGDIYIHDYIKIFMDNERIDQQIVSLEKLITLDFDVLICSHNPKWKNGKKHLQAKLNFLKNFYGEVKRNHDKGMNTKAIMKKMKIDEIWFSKIMSLGKLSRKNMVQSVIRAISEPNSSA